MRSDFSLNTCTMYAGCTFCCSSHCFRCLLSFPLFWASDYACGLTSRDHTGGRPHRNSPSFCGARLNFLSRGGFSRPFPSSAVKSNFVYPRNNRSPLVGHDVRENHSSYDCSEIRTQVPTSEKVSRSQTEPPGRPARIQSNFQSQHDCV